MKVLFLHSKRSNAEEALQFLEDNNLTVSARTVEDGWVLNEKCDLIISYLYPKKISKDILDLAKIGAINFHPAILPENRGYRTYPFAILENTSEYGVTCHLMNEKFDTGDIIDIQKFSIDPEKETCLSLKKKAHSYLLLLFKTIVSYVVRYNELPTATKQSKGKSCNLNKLEYLKFVDLRKIKAEELKRHIRAFWCPPHHTAKIMVDGEEFSLISEEILKELTPKEEISNRRNWIFDGECGIIVNPTKEESL